MLGSAVNSSYYPPAHKQYSDSGTTGTEANDHAQREALQVAAHSCCCARGPSFGQRASGCSHEHAHEPKTDLVVHSLQPAHRAQTCFTADVGQASMRACVLAVSLDSHPACVCQMKCCTLAKPAASASFSCSGPVGNWCMDGRRYSYSGPTPLHRATGTTTLSKHQPCAAFPL